MLVVGDELNKCSSFRSLGKGHGTRQHGEGEQIKEKKGGIWRNEVQEKKYHKGSQTQIKLLSLESGWD